MLVSERAAPAQRDGGGDQEGNNGAGGTYEKQNTKNISKKSKNIMCTMREAN
jgi:hypothetical protein